MRGLDVRTALLIAITQAILAGCGGDDGGNQQPDATLGPPDATPPECTSGDTRCVDNAFQSCVDGFWSAGAPCDNVCDATLGCVICSPGERGCNGDYARVCRANGSGYDETFCDPVQGIACDATSGACSGACAPDSLGQSYVGCEYYPTVTANLVASNYHFAVAIANTSANEVNVLLEDGGLDAPITLTIPAFQVAVQPLPWVSSLKICDLFEPCSPLAVFEAHGAVHLRSDQPITVYQFSPIEYTLAADDFSQSNDASLLLPVTALAGDYYVTSANALASTIPSTITVTATADDTNVTFTTTSDVMGSPGIMTGVPITMTLMRGDVVELPTMTGDFTGSHVQADKPIQVIGGHSCANVPFTVGTCDHLEEVMLPVEKMSTDYLVTAPAVPALPDGKAEVVRIVGVEDAVTTLTYDPPIAGAPTTIDAAGEWIEIGPIDVDFRVRADHKILVAQYMEGQEAGTDATGDPSLALAVPLEQYRSSYLFHAPINYVTNYVNVTAPMDATVMLDGMQVPPLVAIGSSGYGAVRVQLDAGPTLDGNHTVEGDAPFGITVYGYGDYTSYWYPGGLDLITIP